MSEPERWDDHPLGDALMNLEDAIFHAEQTDGDAAGLNDVVQFWLKKVAFLRSIRNHPTQQRRRDA